MENTYELFKTKLNTFLMNQTFSLMFYAFYIVVESIIMYTYICMYPLLYAPWTSSLDGYVRNINVANIIIIIIMAVVV